ncbi:MAG: SAV_6107 family HEPN domain-containing protein [Janthinobacterium lividum]
MITTPASPSTEVPRPLTTAALDLLERCETELLVAFHAKEPADRYVHAHLAALRAGAAVVAVHGRPAGPRRSGPRSVWEMLPRLDPALQDWSERFAATAAQRSAVEAGRTDVVNAVDAAVLFADAESFHHVVESLLGLSRVQPLAS